ncbi:MAG: hypothetical protein IT435_07795 [Phycisphaerales bacterium]|nr:hypothetical protein [Phycisphaerales bacterium]
MAGHHVPHELPVEHEAADAWHHHDLSAEGMPQSEHTAVANPLVLFIVFVVMGVVTFLTVSAVEVYYYRSITNVNGLLSQQDREATLRLASEAQAYSQESERRLANYEWVNGETNTVSIPMETAFERVMQKYPGGDQAAVEQGK